jgi:hypothetical protein
VCDGVPEDAAELVQHTGELFAQVRREGILTGLVAPDVVEPIRYLLNRLGRRLACSN